MWPSAAVTVPRAFNGDSPNALHCCLFLWGCHIQERQQLAITVPMCDQEQSGILQRTLTPNVHAWSSMLVVSVSLICTASSFALWLVSIWEYRKCSGNDGVSFMYDMSHTPRDDSFYAAANGVFQWSGEDFHRVAHRLHMHIHWGKPDELSSTLPP